MSDDISIPRSVTGTGPGPVSQSYSHSYRSRRTGMDTGTRRLVFAASGLGFVLLAGMGIYTVGGHRSAGVPVIEADTRPLRVKPADPGGMTVVGANDQVMGGRGDGVGEAGDLAPEAERPDPQALRAQRQAAAAPATVPSAPVAAAPVAVVAKAVPEPAAKPVAAAAVAGGMMVQVAAVDTEAAATAEWQRLAHKAPELLGDRKPTVVRAERDGKVFWRIRTGGFADTAAATEFCRKVRAKGLGCSIST